MMVTLSVLVGPEFDEEINVLTPTFTIGRAEDCDLRLTCPLVSRHHCQLLFDGIRLTIRDNDSKNGTFVNGQRVVDQQELHSGDIVAAGRRRLAVEIVQEAEGGRQMAECGMKDEG
jgi:pSer/pThr/pTyr-binding forkhead associated (FHA) protein